MDGSERILTSKFFKVIIATFIVFINFTIILAPHTYTAYAAKVTPTPTPTVTSTPTAILSPTGTTTATPTITTTATPTTTSTPIPSSTPKPTKTPTPTPTQTPSPTPTPTPDPNPTKEIVFTEVNWAGSSLGADDEWIELFNNTKNQIQLNKYYIDGALTGGRKANLSGTLEPGAYYLVSKLGLGNSSELSIAPDQIESKMNLVNSGFNLKLYRKDAFFDQIVDDVNTNGAKPFAGNVNPVHASMERIDVNVSGSDPTNWKSAILKKNLKQNHLIGTTCELDYGTPKGKSDFIKLNNEIYFWDICTSAGELNTSNQLEINNFSGNLFGENFRIDNKIYKFTLVGDAIGDQFDVGKFSLLGNDGLIAEKRIPNSTIFALNKGSIIYATSKGTKTNLTVSLNTSLGPSQKLILDKIKIDEIVELPSEINYIAGKFDTESKIVQDTLSSSNLLVIDSGNTEVVFNETLPFFITQNNAIQVEITAKQNPNLSKELENFLELNFSNSHNLKTARKVFKKKDFSENFSTLKFQTILPLKGIQKLSILSKAGTNIQIKNIKVSYVNPLIPEKENLDFTDYVTSSNYDYDKVSDSLVFSSNSQQKIISFQDENICLANYYCSIQIPITLISSSSEEVLSAYFGMKGINKDFTIEKIYSGDFDQSKTYNLKFSKNNKENQILSIKILLSGGSKIKIGKAIFESIPTEMSGKLKSFKNKNWSSLATFTSKSSALGKNGQLLDILGTDSPLLAGNYTFNFKVKKLEKYNTGKDLVKIVGMDASGYQLFESIVDENDLPENQMQIKSLPFKLDSNRKILIYIHYYGNHLGAQSDIQLGEFELK